MFGPEGTSWCDLRHTAERGTADIQGRLAGIADGRYLGLRNPSQRQREYGWGQRHDQRPQHKPGGHGSQE